MEITRKFRCMRCTNEFQAVDTKDGEMVERTCPKCRSNSIRPVKDEPKE